MALDKDPLNLIITGVGGQGNVLASQIVASAGIKEGLFVTVGETYGASQRGGSVMSHVRFSATAQFGPLISEGQADIVVAAVGVPHMLTADMVKPGASVVDVGVSRTEAGLVGDVHPDVWEVAGHVSPNPGGVGPLTRAFLLTNVVERAESQ